MVLVDWYFWGNPGSVGKFRGCCWHYKHVAISFVVPYVQAVLPMLKKVILLGGDGAVFTVESPWILGVVELSQSVVVLHVHSVISTLRTLFVVNDLSFFKLVDVDGLATIWHLLVLDHLELLKGILMENILKVSQWFWVRGRVNHAPSVFRKHSLLRRMATLNRALLQVSLWIGTDKSGLEMGRLLLQ